MCKERFKDSQLTNGQNLGQQVVAEISDTILIDETERTIAVSYTHLTLVNL